MQIHAISLPIAQTSASSSAPGSGTSSTTSDPVQQTDSMFMKLLTAQLQNQSPLDPVDPMQFTTQLVQFNMLDQLTQINSTLHQSLGNGNNTSASGANAISGGN